MKTMFDNGFGVSVVSHGYGSDQGLLELAVITEDGLHYDNSVAQGDVCGYLTKKDTVKLIEEVKSFSTYMGKNYDISYSANNHTEKGGRYV